MSTRIHTKLTLTLATTVVVILTVVSGAHAEYTGPVKEILSSQIGLEVNKTSKGDTCLVASEECQTGTPSNGPGGFQEARGVAVDGDKADVAHYGHVYVTDDHHRVQELEADGKFVSVFGKNVNKKGGDICTKIEESECQAGVEGSAPGQFGETQDSIAVDPVSGDVYVADGVKGKVGGGSVNGERVQEFTAGGEWMLEIGKEVNETKDGTSATAEEKNVCTAAEVKTGVKCTGPKEYPFGGEPAANNSEPGVFTIGASTVVTVGGAEDLLYVGAGERVQEFTTGGAYKDGFALTGQVAGLAVDDSCELHEPVLTGSTIPTCASFDASYGDLYAFYENVSVVHKFEPSGIPVTDLVLSARAENAEFLKIAALAVDPFGRLGVSEFERIGVGGAGFGSLLNAATGHVITEFPVPSIEVRALAFSANDGMYGTGNSEVFSYAPVHVAELLTRPASCVAGAESETDAVFDCALGGEVNPEEVENTEVAFQWGLTSAFGGETLVQSLCTTVCGSALVTTVPGMIDSVAPNERVDYRLAAHDQNVTRPELLTSDTASLMTPVVAPRIVGEPTAPFVGSSYVVFSGQVNPENAPTEYYFEYATQPAGYCEGTSRSASLSSAAYGKVGVTLEATGLQPATTYRYRLCARNTAGDARDEHGGGAIGEGTFTTLPSPVPRAVTGGYSALATTSAVVSGTVDPDGQSATYAFELGVNRGAGTQYDVVVTGPVAAGILPVDESLRLTGLQAGTEYAYRVSIKSGYGESKGAPATFTTQGLPSALAVPASLALLGVPSIVFPAEEKPVVAKKTIKCAKSKKLRHGKCVKLKKGSTKHKRKPAKAKK